MIPLNKRRLLVVKGKEYQIHVMKSISHKWDFTIYHRWLALKIISSMSVNSKLMSIISIRCIDLLSHLLSYNYDSFVLN